MEPGIPTNQFNNETFYFADCDILSGMVTTESYNFDLMSK